jgi:hypothetical protein
MARALLTEVVFLASANDSTIQTMYVESPNITTTYMESTMEVYNKSMAKNSTHLMQKFDEAMLY